LGVKLRMGRAPGMEKVGVLKEAEVHFGNLKRN
jgi:hypothetical protein